MSELKEIFIDYAIKHGQAIEQGDHKTANKIHEKLTALYVKLKSNENWDVLKELVKHNDESVRLWAATFLLKNDTILSLQVLNGLKESDKIIGLTASTTIDMWSKGMLQL
jgi:hypothetical protein